MENIPEVEKKVDKRVNVNQPSKKTTIAVYLPQFRQLRYYRNPPEKVHPVSMFEQV